MFCTGRPLETGMDDVFGGDGGDEESFAKTRPQSAGSSSDVPTQALTSSLQDVAVVVDASLSSQRSSSRSDPVANLRALLDEVKGSQEQMQIISTEMIVEAHTKLLGEVRQMNEELAKQLTDVKADVARLASGMPTGGSPGTTPSSTPHYQRRADAPKPTPEMSPRAKLDPKSVDTVEDLGQLLAENADLDRLVQKVREAQKHQNSAVRRPAPPSRPPSARRAQPHCRNASPRPSPEAAALRI